MVGTPRAVAVTVRPATADDIAPIATIWQAGWTDGHGGHVPVELERERIDGPWLSRTRDRIAATIVAELPDGRLAGFVTIVDDELEQVYVAADNRGLGVADILVRQAEDRVRAAGHATAWLAVVAGNTRARRFYERLGWRDTGPFEHHAEAAGGTIAVPALRYERALCAPAQAAGPRSR